MGKSAATLGCKIMVGNPSVIIGDGTYEYTYDEEFDDDDSSLFPDDYFDFLSGNGISSHETAKTKGPEEADSQKAKPEGSMLEGAVPDNGNAVNIALHVKHLDELTALNRQGLLDELSQTGIKHTPENIVDIRKMHDGKIVFLETGNRQAGLEHILVRHQQDFASVGVHADQIPDAVMTAVTQGKIIGYQGKNQGRTIYDVVFNDTRHQISVTVSENGFVVGANPQSRISPYITE